MVTILIVIAILVLLIVTHELGHFLAAKLFRVRVDEFGVGYPPRAFLLGKIGATEYTLNWIPFGGFVRLYGEDEGGEHGKGSFVDAPRWKQAIILVAGIIANTIVALLLFATALHVGLPRAVPNPTPGARLLVSDIVPGSPADASGILAGDEITSVSDDALRTIDAPNTDTFTAFVREHPGKAIEVHYTRAGSQKMATMKPAQGVLKDNAGQAALGIGLILVSNVGVPWGQAITDAFPFAYTEFVQTTKGLVGIFQSSIHGSPNLTDVVGPIGLVSVVGGAAHNGIGEVLALAGFIAVNLAVINLIPIPALDGVRLLIVIIEAITRRRAPILAVQLLNMIGIALIILLMVVVTYHDIARLFG